jgi:PPIC-type PPIASE domain
MHLRIEKTRLKAGVSRWLMDPMVHFLLAGALLYAAHAWLNPKDRAEARVVRLTEAEVNWLRETWARQWHRPPDRDELRGLISDYLKEGLLAREARELGMDENDTVIRRRLAQKMEFVVKNTASLAEPGEDELYRLYIADPAKYQLPNRVSFTQIFFRSEDSARRGLQRLESLGADAIGDATLLERDYSGADKEAVANVFGPEFAESIFGLETRRWHGPIVSPYGFHLVKIVQHEAAKPRPFGEVRSDLVEEWHSTQQSRAYADYISTLLKKYEVIVEGNAGPLVVPFDLETQ